ncbi:unnamed protein product [Phyllotreta striolata]|uniref:Uncharacterized protein n=1 Tax=Phyllotreta striolata TaxID=444603 RepID=A0A9N9TMN8_PHYSR|nr:unnamed protein product [Phyllotreta striolata]
MFPLHLLIFICFAIAPVFSFPEANYDCRKNICSDIKLTVPVRLVFTFRTSKNSSTPESQPGAQSGSDGGLPNAQDNESSPATAGRAAPAVIPSQNEGAAQSTPNPTVTTLKET